MAEARGRAEHKELLIKGILDSYADAYRNCLKFPVEPELYREDWDFINRLNEKMVYTAAATGSLICSAAAVPIMEQTEVKSIRCQILKKRE